VRRLPVTEAVASGAAVGDPWLPGGLGTVPSVPIAVLAAGPSADGEVLVLGVEVQLTAAAEMLGAATERHGVALFDREGSVLVGGGHALLRPDLLRALLGTDSDFGYGSGEAEVLGSLVPVPYTQWSVAVFEPRTLVRAPARRIQAQLWPLLALAALIAVTVAVGIAGTLSRPVEDLRDAALDLAAGARGRRTGVDRSDEIGELARAFDHMSTRLDASRKEIDAQQEEIEAFNRELQQRVADRTRQLEEAQAELVRSGQLAAVAQVGAGLAHELNNPLAAVLGLSQVLKLRYPEEALLTDLEGEAARCREVVGDLLRFTSGEVDPTDAPVVDLREVLDEVLRLVGGAFKQRGVALILADDGVEPSPLRVRLDRVAGSRILAQVLHALRAGLGAGATVQVTPRAVGDRVQVRFDADRPLAHDTSRRDDWMASGLDLWVARQLLDRLHGRLDESHGRSGTRFVLTLPSARGGAA
jgi:signal transduction histidine kinase